MDINIESTKLSEIPTKSANLDPIHTPANYPQTALLKLFHVT
ncbi:hypothetical protein [Teredinibacter turnerae]|nr:hypothetical protein [Teredinibacter turnerae]